MKKIRLLIIEDNRLLRDGITKLLRAHTDIKVIVAAGSGDSRILKLHELKPSVILLDLGLRSRSSLQVVELVQKEFPQAKVIVMDLAPAYGDILQFVKAGASGFILKDATVDDFVATIRSVAEGDKVLPSALYGSLFTQIIEQATEGGKANVNKAIKMTKREKEVISLISEGLSNKEIGTNLHVATYTVKSHIHNIMEKLALHTRLEVANYTYTDGTLAKEVAESISLFST